MPPPPVTILEAKPADVPMTFVYAARASDARRVEVRARVAGTLRIPGFVNAHSHTFQRALRGRAESLAAENAGLSDRVGALTREVSTLEQRLAAAGLREIAALPDPVGEVVRVPLEKLGGAREGFRVLDPAGAEAPWQVAGGALGGHEALHFHPGDAALDEALDVLQVAHLLGVHQGHRGALAAGPAGAAIGAMAQAVFQTPLKRATRTVYSIQGPWAKPEVDVVERGPRPRNGLEPPPPAPTSSP